MLVSLVLGVLSRRDALGDPCATEEESVQCNGASQTPVEAFSSGGDGEEIDGVPDANFTEEVGVSAVAPKTTLSKETALVVAIERNLVLHHLELASLKVKLLLIGHGFGDEESGEKTSSYPVKVGKTSRLGSNLVCNVNWASHREQQQILVRSDEENVQ